MDPAELHELEGVLDRFLEKASTATLAAKRDKYARQYKRLIATRFKAQRDWFLDHALPVLNLGEGLREADASGDVVAAAITGLIDEWFDDPDTVKQLDQLVKLAFAAGVDVLSATVTPEELAAALATLIAKRGGVAIQFGLDNPRALEYLKDHAFEITGEALDAVTRDVIKDILIESFENHLGYDAIAKAIRAEFDDMSRQRATTIATYEIGNAYIAGKMAGAQDLDAAGIEQEKSWLTAGDDRVSDDCETNEASGWIDLDDDFPSGDAAPLAHPNCRCDLLFRRKEVEVAA